ncbi:hypothetical protein [Paenibacillus sp. P22]|uniref:hypothetical protein n=1 Tax=Paenibacillus sp. P22 TaxID=483908 RepID=UPI00043340DD|nr:hypothetical protein [Paenibacillus sp. P22]CDN43415.1 hypothetical protein BN871_CX_00110 [Paenibacillus sp. P22]
MLYSSGSLPTCQPLASGAVDASGDGAVEAAGSGEAPLLPADPELPPPVVAA